MRTLVLLLTALVLLSCSTEESKTRTSPIILKPETPADTQPNTLHGSYKLVKVDTVDTSNPFDKFTTTYTPPEATGKMTLDLQRRTQCCIYGNFSIDLTVPVQQIKIDAFYISSSEDNITLEWEIKNGANEGGRIISNLQIEWKDNVLVMKTISLFDSDYYHSCYWIKNQP